MSEEEQNKYDIIQLLVNHEINRNQAKESLNISLRQVDRLVIKFKTEGEAGFIHKNKGKSSDKKVDRNLIERLEEQYLTEYYDYNFRAFYDEICNKYQISYNTMVNEFKKDDIISPLSHKKTIKLYKEKMKNATRKDSDVIESEMLNLYESRILSIEQAHTRKSNNYFYFGQEVQMDACEKLWFGNIVSYLHLAVDKGTKKVLFGWFEYEELTRGYFVVLFHMIINYGIPKLIKTDNRSSFHANNNKKSKFNTTQFGKICAQLGIELITTSVATSKANVERENGTFKNRLIAELRHENIIDIDDANKYLNEIFIPKMNTKFSYKIDKRTSQMKENPYTEEELKLVISEKISKKIDNAGAISYKKHYYVPIDIETGELVNFKVKTECLFIISYDYTYWSKIEDKYYMMLQLENRDSIMEKEIKQPIVKEKKKYIPPSNHPWRNYKKPKRIINRNEEKINE